MNIVIDKLNAGRSNAHTELRPVGGITATVCIGDAISGGGDRGAPARASRGATAARYSAALDRTEDMSKKSLCAACRPTSAWSFIASVHAAQKRTGLWLPQHPFVQEVRAGSATRDELGRWVRQVYCITRTYAATLLSLCPPPPVGVWLDPWSDLELLFDLGGALGISPRELRSSEPGFAARGIQIWLGHHLTRPSRHIAAQACWALVESMSPKAGTKLASGAKEHFGLKTGELRYFRDAMKSRRHGDRYAATLLDRIPFTNWPAIYSQAMLVSGLLADLYGSIRCGPVNQAPIVSRKPIGMERR